jgi:hypothetical protein
MNENIEFWANFWKWLLILGSGGFVVLLLYTIVHGAIDIKRLLTELRKRRDESQEESLH